MALDIESLDEDRDMNLANARRFIRHIREKTGRYPMLYATMQCERDFAEVSTRRSLLKSTSLVCGFKSRVTDFPTATWDTYLLLAVLQ